jgi:hypothetical protein
MADSMICTNLTTGTSSGTPLKWDWTTYEEKIVAIYGTFGGSAKAQLWAVDNSSNSSLHLLLETDVAVLKTLKLSRSFSLFVTIISPDASTSISAKVR